MGETTILLDGLRFPEGPRWHEGRLWFSDMHARQVIAVDLAFSLSRPSSTIAFIRAVWWFGAIE